MTAAEIRQLYRDGMREAFRVLKANGLLWVKTKDQVESARQCWQHVELYNDALTLGFQGRDLFVVLTSPPNPSRWHGKKQQHAFKNCGYLWIFEKARRPSSNNRRER